MLQIDSLNADNNVTKLATQKYITPEVVTIATLNANKESYQGKLIQIDNVNFRDAGLGLTFADGTNQVSGDRALKNTDGDTINVRTSGYANFANDTLPLGNGSFIGICTQYNADLQLIIRTPSELTLNGPIPVIINKNFDDNSITSGGWTTQIVTGTFNWVIGTTGGTYAQISNYVSPNNTASESWLISPSLDLSTSTTPSLQFRNAWKYTGAPLQLMISTNYDGVSAPSTATWTDISSQAVWSAGSFAWANSGVINLSSYLQPTVYIAFKYTGSNTSGSTWEIDDIKIQK